MGCRTRANEYYSEGLYRNEQKNRRPQAPVEGTAVRKTAVQHRDTVKIKKNKRAQVSASQKNVLKRQQHRFIALGAAAAVIVVGLAALMLNLMDAKDSLNSQIRAKESTLADLTVYNEAKEYDINCSVDLNYVIQVATENLGMVRSNPAQVITYSVKNSEYLLQVAAVPTE